MRHTSCDYVQTETCGQLAADLHVGLLISPQYIAQDFFNRVAAKGEVQQFGQHLKAGQRFLQWSFSANDAEGFVFVAVALAEPTTRWPLGGLFRGLFGGDG